MPTTNKKKSAPLRARLGMLLALFAPLFATLFATFYTSQAHAQTPSPLPEWQYSVGVPLRKLYAPDIPTWEVRVGAAMTVRPRYEGANDYYILGGPSIDVRYKDLAFASTGEGIGFNAIHTERVRMGLAITYDMGRREKKDHDHLAGMGNIGIVPETKIFAEYVVSKEFPLVIRANIRRQLGGSDGWIGDVGAYMPMPGSSEKFFWFLGPTMSFADSRYMQTWFGVNAQQAARSQYAEYHPGGGIKSYGGGVSAIWMFSKHWFATADFGVSALVGDARNSPIVQRSTNLTGDISVNYQF